MAPCSHKSSKNTARKSILEVIWGHLGCQVGTKFDFRCVFFEVRILVKKQGLGRPPGAPQIFQGPQVQGGGPLKNS